MKTHLKRLISTTAAIAALAALLLGAPAQATPLDDLEASVSQQDAAGKHELDRINTERAKINKRFAEEDKACFKKFAVNPCREALNADKRTSLAALRKQEVAINDAQRQRRSHLQEERVKQRQLDETERRATAAREAADKAERQPNAPLSPQGKPSEERGPREAPKPHAPNTRKPPAPVDRSGMNADERARYDQKQKEATEHRAEIERRNAERDPSKQPKPLPAPPQ